MRVAFLVIFQVLAFLCCASGLLRVHAGEEEKAGLTLTILGSGTPVPSATQFGTAILVQAGDQALLFDCGRGCTTRLAEVDPALIPKVNHLFVTHLHSDHIVGIDDLWLNGWVQGRTAPLAIWGPEGTTEMMHNMAKTFQYDINKRYEDGVPATRSGLDDAFADITHNGTVYDNGGLRVIAFEVDHSTVKPAWGYRVEYKGKVVMISGDTTLTDSLYTYGKGADVIVQEVMSPALIAYLESHFKPEQVARIVGYHTTAGQAAKLFAQTRPRLAVYYHTRNDGAFAQTLLDETRKGYGGAVEVGYDLMQIIVGDTIIVQHAPDPAP
ncbi:MBL fold metallo-hydrolase [Kordiimonas pumila]|uniref:MBL fold metallo-hydrolase n=1 Tax=Kordiimonas pumila TaxID=2161677 RepID=A0ABV7D028_9PROT|nr:MBL fold metallo-hydrolase [Kordiimonas pumila]